MKKDPIANNEKVLAHTKEGNVIPWNMGELKQAFLSKKLPYQVLFLSFRNKQYYVSYNPTKGFTFQELNEEQLEKLREGKLDTNE